MDTGVVWPLKCDSDGNVYFRFQTADRRSFNVSRFAPDGTQKATYRSSNIPELKDSTVNDFSIAEDGKLYELVWLGKSIYIVEFSKDGEIEGKTELTVEQPLIPAQLEALAGGNFFVTGSLVGDKTGHDAGKPFNAIFDNSGKLVREVTFKKDAEPKEAPKTANRSGDANHSILFGRTALGEDGNLYVMRAVSPAVVYVISPAGRLLRTLRIQPLIKNAQPVALLTGAGRLAVEFDVPDTPDVSDTLIRVVDARTGRNVVDYRTTRQLGEAVACYTTEGFTFIGSDENLWPTIAQASAR
jgi:hypothetical protein